REQPGLFRGRPASGKIAEARPLRKIIVPSESGALSSAPMKKRPRPKARHTASGSARPRRKTSAPSGTRSAKASEKSAPVAIEKSGRPVLVFLPNQREKKLATKALTHGGVRAEFFEQLDHLATQLDDQTGAVLLAQEAFADTAAPQLMKRLREQPKWSDLPLLVATGGTQIPGRVRDLAGASANVMLIARPLRDFTLISAVRATLRARRSQFEARDLIEERDTVLSSISEAFSAID